MIQSINESARPDWRGIMKLVIVRAWIVSVIINIVNTTNRLTKLLVFFQELKKVEKKRFVFQDVCSTGKNIWSLNCPVSVHLHRSVVDDSKLILSKGVIFYRCRLVSRRWNALINDIIQTEDRISCDKNRKAFCNNHWRTICTQVVPSNVILEVIQQNLSWQILSFPFEGIAGTVNPWCRMLWWKSLGG